MPLRDNNIASDNNQVGNIIKQQEKAFSTLWQCVHVANEGAITTEPTASSREGDEDANPSILVKILGDAYSLQQQEEDAQEKRFAMFLHDMREVLTLPTGAGIRVLRHWLDAACGAEQIYALDSSIYAHAALADYAKQRMAEVALADPASFLQLQLVSAQQIIKPLHHKE